MGEDLKISLVLAGGPKPCSEVGPLTVIVIWRDDFRICTHLFVYENCRENIFVFFWIDREREREVPKHTQHNGNKR